MARTLTERLLSPIVQVRPEESATALLMFGYSFLAMTAYNVVQPLTRSRFISALGSENLPWVLLVSVFIIGLLMQGYSKLGALLPGRWVIPATQAGMVVILIAFWLLFSETRTWVEVAFYLFGQIYGILLISQFWTLANLIYDPRAAKRLFGFIGGGASLGGILGGTIGTAAKALGNENLVLVSAVALTACAMVVVIIIKRASNVELSGLESAGEEKGVSGAEALKMLAQSKHLQIIAIVIALTSIGAGLIDQQLNMAAEAFKGRDDTDSLTVVLAQVQVWVSTIGFVIQVWLTSRIHRLLGVGFALLILPFGLGLTAGVIILNAALWAPTFARVLDKSLRYTVDKTSREILFLPLPLHIKQQAKPFVDVTVDRFARALQAFLLLVMLQPWGLNMGVEDWQKISYVSLAVMGLWIFMAIRAKKGYLAAFRKSIERQDMRPAEMRLDVADLSTVETLVEELAHPDEGRVLYAIDMLESLDKRNLVTPLLLHHESAPVRTRALQALGAARTEIAEHWLPSIQRMIGDPSPEVRAAAVGALASIRKEEASGLVRPLLDDQDSRIASTAAVVLAQSGSEADLALAEQALERLTSDTQETGASGRRDAAVAIRQVGDAGVHRLLIPLITDPDPDVAEEAIRSAGMLNTSDYLFVPSLVSLLRNRRLKSSARTVLVNYGEDVLDALNHFLRDEEEDIWVRRHLPATIALIPCQKSMEILAAAIVERDGFLRYKVIQSLQKLRRERADLKFQPEPIEALALKEGRRYFNYLSLHHNLFIKGKLPAESLLARALDEKIQRTVDRVYRLLGLIYPWKDIAAARWAIERGEARARSSALEYLDNILTGNVRKLLMPVIEDLPHDEKVQRGNVILRTRSRDVEETLLQLINDDDAVVSACAIDLVRERQLWNLEADIEHVLAHRDVKDWYVFESASWTLASRRMKEDDRRKRWLEPLPVVELAARLRQRPMFSAIWVDELFRIAEIGRQVRHEAGRVLFQEGSAPEGLQILLDGRVTATTRAGGSREIDPPATLGFEATLEGSPMPETIRTSDVTVCLALGLEETRTLLADNSDIVQGLFKRLADRLGNTGRALVESDAVARFGRRTPAALSPIEKVLVLQKVPLFAAVSADEMLQLATVARQAPVQQGAEVFGEADRPALIVVLDGEIAVELAERPARAGDIIGLYETLADTPMSRKATTQASGSLLRIDRDELFDLLGQRPDLLQQVFSALLRPAGRRGEAAAPVT